MSEDSVPRRQFLLGAGLAGTAIAAGIAEPVQAQQPVPAAPTPATEAEPFITLTALEAAFIVAAVDTLIPADEPIITVPRIRSKEDGINAARAMLGSAYFDNDNCKVGLAMLRGYHKSAMGQPVHGPGPHSHGADAFQTAAVGFHLVTGLSASMLRRGAMRRKIRGLV